MKVKTNVKAGGIILRNHNETLVRDGARAKGVRVKTNVKAGGRMGRNPATGDANHNETLVRDISK